MINSDTTNSKKNKACVHVIVLVFTNTKALAPFFCPCAFLQIKSSFYRPFTVFFMICFLLQLYKFLLMPDIIFSE